MPSLDYQQRLNPGHRDLDSLPEGTCSAAETVWAYLHIGAPIQRRADYIVGLGSYDTRVATYCATLLLENWASSIVFSGNSGNWTRDVWHDSEAQIFSDRAVAAGVPLDRIIKEEKSTNVGENIAFTKKLLSHDYPVPGTVILVSKPSSERRVLATARHIWPEVSFAMSSPPMTFREQYIGSPRPEVLLDEMAGEIHRLIEYPSRNYFSRQSIPGDVMNAYQHLLDVGCRNHLSA
ncbi:hypothetical protein PIN31009_02366 [Pandoraea iniqua]|nr:hypothetical protein PIN31009_02366 [Pandoraea iniqua]